MFLGTLSAIAVDLHHMVRHHKIRRVGDFLFQMGKRAFRQILHPVAIPADHIMPMRVSFRRTIKAFTIFQLSSDDFSPLLHHHQIPVNR